jgi:S1-C subfamily serine protease
MGFSLNDISSALSSVALQGHASVVRVEARRRLPSSGVAWAKGIVIASHHAVERDENIRIGLPDGKEVDAELAGRDPSTDIAVLKAATDHLPLPSWTDDGTLALAHVVVALGRPGEIPCANLGIISALGDEWRTYGGGRVERYVQTDIDLRPGFSGGLLLDGSGRAVGMNTSGLIRGRAMVVPTATLRRVVDAVLRKGHVQRGYLGIGSHPVRLSGELEKLANQEAGLIVVSVRPKGPAEKAGVMLGDVVLSLDGKSVSDVGGLIELLDEDRIGSDAKLRLVRAGELKDVQITIGARSWT